MKHPIIYVWISDGWSNSEIDRLKAWTRFENVTYSQTVSEADIAIFRKTSQVRDMQSRIGEDTVICYLSNDDTYIQGLFRRNYVSWPNTELAIRMFSHALASKQAP